MKKLLIIFGIVIGCLISSTSYAEKTDFENYLVLKESSVSVITVYTDESASSCTGIVIVKDEKKTGILTAKHCVTNKVKNVYIVSDYNYYHASSYKTSKFYDVAYVEINTRLDKQNPIKIASRDAKRKSIVYFLGLLPTGEYFRPGIIGYKSITNVYIFSVALKGCSGAGIINTKGELVGILWGGFVMGDVELTVMTPIKKIRPFLIKCKIWNKVRF